MKLGFFLSVFALVFSFGSYSKAAKLDCSTAVAPDGTVFKIQSGTTSNVFGSTGRGISIQKINYSSGLAIPRYYYEFSLDHVTKQTPYISFDGINMVNTGEGIGGMTNFDSLTGSINSQTKQGELRVTHSYNSSTWGLKFTCASVLGN